MKVEFRPIVAFEKKGKEYSPFRIEICKETGSRHLSPFVRKLSLGEIYNHCIPEAEQLVAFIEQCGSASQPFVFPHALLDLNSVYSLLSSYPYLYLSQNNSMKKLSTLSVCCSSSFHQYLSVGKLLKGILYIDHLSFWNRSIQLRFLYKGAKQSYHAQYNAIPCVAIDGSLFLRDQQAEIGWLDDLGGHWDGERVSLDAENAVSVLQKLKEKGWEILLSKDLCPQAVAAPLVFHSLPSGIQWFDTQIDTNDVDILDAYLKGRNYVDFQKGIALFSPKEVKRALDKDLSAVGDSQTLKEGGVNWEKIGNSLSGVLEQEEISQIQKGVNKHVHANLRDYQMDGVLWLHTMRKRQTGCLLADDMGLGKTLQVLAFLATCPDLLGKCLVVCSASLKPNWEAEAGRFTPQLLSLIDFVTYDQLRFHKDEYTSLSFDVVVLDEAQLIKNSDTKRFDAVACIQTKQFVVLTGTPIENSIEDVWTYFSILVPSLMPLHRALKRMTNPEVYSRYVDLSSRILAPYILRRTKEEVLKDLPPIIEKNVYVTLSDEERMVYDKVHQSIVRALKIGVSGRISSLALEGLLRLRQACVSDELLPIELNPYGNTYSSKMNTVISLIKTFQKENHKCIVFSQFVQAMLLLEKKLEKENIPFVSLYGTTHNRKEPVDSFQLNPAIKVMLVSLKAGGTGLNLTAADRVILLDDWWNPAVEDQAMARAHRIGQKNTVMVFRLICQNTVEEKIWELQERKRNLIADFNKASQSITLEDIQNLIGFVE